MDVILNFSPNFSKKTRRKKDIKYVIIHYTGMQSEIESIKRLKNPKSKVSCHYLINRKGIIIQMVNEKFSAWHAGKSKWSKFKNLNFNSIGIELVNRGHQFGYERFTKKQIKSLITLCIRLKKKYKINRINFLGHSDIAPLRKIDPGEYFPWEKLSEHGIGRWFKDDKLSKISINSDKIKKAFFQNLRKLGYRYFKINKRNTKDKKIIKSFQQHFLPKNITGKIDQKTFKVSDFLTK